MNITKYLQYGFVALIAAGVLAVPLYLFYGRADAASVEGQQTGTTYETTTAKSGARTDETAISGGQNGNVYLEGQSGNGEDKTSSAESTYQVPSSTADTTNGGLSPNPYTSENYIPPAYDPFNNKYKPYTEFEEKIQPGDRAANTPPTAKFATRTKQTGLADTSAGTTQTDFIFDAFASTDSETWDSNLLVRFDFESDGKPDTYFSRTKRVYHKFDQPGVYKVTLEAMDGGGLIGTYSAQVTVVENTEPFAHFYYNPVSGTTGRIFTFTTSKSSDSQYLDSYLEYRFDWDGDGVWDTPYQQKTIWRHQFSEPGSYKIIMEAKDPEGATDTSWAAIDVFENTLPTASFTIEKKESKVYGTYGTDYTGLGDGLNAPGTAARYKTEYVFDASASSDAENPAKLKFRWDFNYTGVNDIQYDTLWQNSPKASGHYDFPGEKTIRLQVMDEDGATAVSYAKIVAE